MPDPTTCTFGYKLGEQIMIRETLHPGRITGLMAEATGHQYRVVWWNNGERKQEWLFEFELMPVATRS